MEGNNGSDNLTFMPNVESTRLPLPMPSPSVAGGSPMSHMSPVAHLEAHLSSRTAPVRSVSPVGLTKEDEALLVNAIGPDNLSQFVHRFRAKGVDQQNEEEHIFKKPLPPKPKSPRALKEASRMYKSTDVSSYKMSCFMTHVIFHNLIFFNRLSTRSCTGLTKINLAPRPRMR